MTAVIPSPTIQEFVDGATCGLFEVDPLESDAPTSSAMTASGVDFDDHCCR